ncbi:glycosyltransferase family 2 protein [Allorhizobium sp. NPDC080224]|uniref:glycosyltransferase family 2 protein n=1 Tax=Allorhizobium sp. NPDC080224 TaxID=3390547 RepID=UPI003D0451B5
MRYGFDTGWGKMGGQSKLSVVATLYQSEATVVEFYERCVHAVSRHFAEFEIVFVDDGSRDGSLKLALELKDRDPRVVVVELSRNFGHHRAMMTGLAVASGDYVFLIDSDLEEEPELLDMFVSRFNVGDCDVVYGVQERRKGGRVERVTGEVFFWLVERLSDEKLPRNLVTARFMTRDYVRALVRHRDREFFIAHLWLLTGFRQVPLKVRKLSLSPTTYSFSRRLEMLVKYVTTTSTRLLYMILYLGLATASFSAVMILYTIGRYISTGVATDGWTSLIVTVSFFGGLNVLLLGIIGIYIANIFTESKRRPYTVIRRIHRGQPSVALTTTDSRG